MEFWTKQEFKQFLPSMDKKPEARMAFMLLYWTGMRIGELLALTYEDIDLEKRIISISKSYQRLDGKDVITPPKTSKSNRIIKICIGGRRLHWWYQRCYRIKSVDCIREAGTCYSHGAIWCGMAAKGYT